MKSNTLMPLANILLIFLFYINPSDNIYALQEKYDSLEIVSITDFTISGSANPGDTVQINVSFQSTVNDTGIVRIVFTDAHRPINILPNEYSISYAIPMDSGDTYNRTYYFILGNEKKF